MPDYVIFDLEATCWESGTRPERMEIIEIGAVMLSQNLAPVKEYSAFVKPVAEPVLERAGYLNLKVAYTGEEGLCIAKEWGTNLIISDITHPGPDGIKIFEKLFLHPKTLSTRFIIVVAREMP